MSWSLVSGKLALNKQVPKTQEGQIGVKVIHFAVSSLDSNLITRAEESQTHSLGTAAYGVVESIPAQLNGSFQIGDKVGVTIVRSSCSACAQCIQGRENLCSKVKNADKFEGVSYYAPSLSVNHQWLFSVPRSIPESSIVLLLSEGALAYSALRRYAKQGDSIGIIGAGSLGRLAVAYARALGYKTTLIASQQELSTSAVPEGVETGENISKFQLKFHVVLNTVKTLHNETIANQLASTRRGGRFIILGSSGSKDLNLPFAALIHDQRQIIFLESGSRTDVHDALEVASKFKIHPTAEVLGFDKTQEAYSRVETTDGGENSIVIQV